MIIKLTDGKWRITTCKDVKQGLNLLATKKFNLLITDIEMPALGGRDLVMKIEQKDLKVIGMTAHEKDIMPSLLSAGFSACLFKPFTLQELAETLSKVTSSELIKLSVTEEETKLPNRFSSLTAFASGDTDAEREILRCFLTDLRQGISLAEEAIKSLDRKKLSHFAHKVLPFMTMVEASTVDKLKSLLKENIQNLSDEELLLSVEAIISEMKEMANEVDAFLVDNC
ncbi:MAG: response regulator [Prevotella sp.]|nr:response regulator [Prevotella sp.]